MALSGAAKTAVKVRARRIDQRALIDVFTAELDAARHHDLTDEHSTLLALYASCVRPALAWIHGDPYNATFPESFQEERLVKMCNYLKCVTDLTAPAIREDMLAKLHLLAEDYANICCGPDTYDENTPKLGYEYRILHWSFDAIASLWHYADGEIPDDARTITPLPKFANTDCGNLSESFHLTALAVLYLNRQNGLALCDLTPKGAS